MKKTLLLLFFSILFFAAFAQSEIKPINWSAVERLAENQPDSIRALVDRLVAVDRTLTGDEKRLAVYGQSILTKDRDENMAAQAEEAYEAGKYKEAYRLAKNALNMNALSLTALRIAEWSIMKQLEAGSPNFFESDAEAFRKRANSIYSTIETTGDGTQKMPFFVTKVSDEYNFMRYYLELQEFAGQNLVGNCDVIDLAQISQYYTKKKIWFEASRPLKLAKEKTK